MKKKFIRKSVKNFYSNGYVFTWPELFFVHNVHSPALQIQHDACVKTNMENQEKLNYF